jgi:hypothetical protein
MLTLLLDLPTGILTLESIAAAAALVYPATN